MEKDVETLLIKKTTGTILGLTCAYMVYDLTKLALSLGHDGVTLITAFSLLGVIAGMKLKDIVKAKEAIEATTKALEEKK